MSLDELMRRARIWRGGELPPGATQATGFAALDAILPGQGWPQTGLTEIHAAATGIGALQLVLPALAALSRQGHWIVWINPPYQPHAPALSAQGLDLARLLVVDLPAQPGAARDEMLWVYEQALRFTACGAALAWFGHVPSLHLRRLQLAAEAGRTWGVAFRPVDTLEQASPALLRLTLEAVANEIETGRPAPIEITLLKARGGRAGRRCRLKLDAAPQPGDDRLPAACRT